MDGDGRISRDGDRYTWRPPEDGPGSLRFRYKVDRQRGSGAYDARITERWALLRADGALLVLPVAAVVFLLILVIGRGLRRATRAVTRWLGEVMGPRAARVVGVAVVLTTVALLFNGVIFSRVAAGVNAAFSLTNGGTPDGLSAPESPLRSGSPDSLIEWDTLGFQGRGFAGQGPTASRIAEVAEEAGGQAPHTMDPIRAYAGLA